MQDAGKAAREDTDVAAERQRVKAGSADNDSLCLKNLHKAYGSKVCTKSKCTFALNAPLGLGCSILSAFLSP